MATCRWGNSERETHLRTVENQYTTTSVALCSASRDLQGVDADESHKTSPDLDGQGTGPCLQLHGQGSGPDPPLHGQGEYSKHERSVKHIL